MYLDHFRLKDRPFSITPDPRFVYLSARHRDGLAHLLYGLGQSGSGGFVVLTGEVGTGKTTLCRLALEQLPEKTEVALILNPKLSPIELLEALCEELKCDISAANGSQKQLVDRLNAHLLQAHANGLRVVLMLDEAQQLSIQSLEQIRLLTNLETATQKLLQIILLGQPELNVLLERPELRQLAQRITARYHLMPLTADETAAYLEHRLSIAGNTHQLFEAKAVRALYQASGGIPRVINVLADHSLLAAFAQGADRVSRFHVARARAEVMPLATAQQQRTRTASLWVLGAIALAIGLFYLYIALQAAPNADLPTARKPVAISQPNTPVQSSAAPIDAAIDALDVYLKRFGLTPTPELREKLMRCRIQFAPGLRCLNAKVPSDFIKASNPSFLLRTDQRWELAPIKSTSTEFHILALYALPDDVPQAFTQGYAGPGVSLLASQLAKLDGGSALQKIYGPRMGERVIRLQRELGIAADGVVGPATWLALSLRQ